MLLISVYLLNMVLYTIILKSINYYYNIDNIFFCCFLFGIYFPLLFLYTNYNKLVFQQNDYICGVLDYIQLILFYVSINNISIPEYLSYRTSSLVFNLILAYLFLNKEMTKIKIAGLTIVIISCLALLFVNGITNIFYSLLVVIASFIYSLINFIIEKYPDSSNYIQTKTISTFLNIFTYMIYNIINNDVINNIRTNSQEQAFWLMIFFMGFSELFYYYIKTLIINTGENNENFSGSVYINVLDVTRRVITLIVGIIIFKDVYEISYFVCFSFICIGCIFIQFSNQIEKYFVNTYNILNLSNSSDLPT
jgi:drug/metabolite transporter (DMT)-like permease